MKNILSVILLVILQQPLLANASSDVNSYNSNLKNCTPDTLAYPHPLVKGFEAKKIIKGRVNGKCAVDELMPNNMKMICLFSDKCLNAVSAPIKDKISDEAQQCLADECNSKYN